MKGRGGLCCISEKRVPVQIPDGYPCSKVPESSSTSRLFVYIFRPSCRTLWWKMNLCGKMAAAGRGSLRPYQPWKGHNYIVVGLLLVIMVLSYNYWVTSDTKNRQSYDISSLQASLQRLRQADSMLKVSDTSNAVY